MNSGTNAGLLGVWGSSSSDVFAVGDHKTIQHYDGTNWSGMKGGSEGWYGDVWGSGGSDVFVVWRSRQHPALQWCVLARNEQRLRRVAMAYGGAAAATSTP